MGTVYLVSGTILVALPLGVLAAIYLVNMPSGTGGRDDRNRDRQSCRVPSVVYGLFMGFFVIFFKFGASILAGP